VRTINDTHEPTLQSTHPTPSSAFAGEYVNRRFLLLAAFVAIPSLASAQRSRTASDRRTELFDKDSSSAKQAPVVRARDLEDMSPIKLMIDKRKDLKLTDAELSQLKDSDGKLREKNAPLLKAVDSLVRDLRWTGGTRSPSDEDRTRIRNARIGLMSTVGEIRANYDASAKEALATFDADQQPKANEMLDKQKQDAEKYLQERLNGGERRGGE
jgi:hypothetical protein